MNDLHKDIETPPRPAAPLSPEFRNRLLLAVQETVAEARAGRLVPAPLSPAFSERLKAGMMAESARVRRRRSYHRWLYGLASCVVAGAVAMSLLWWPSTQPAVMAGTPELHASASREVTETPAGTTCCDTVVIVDEDHSVFRVRMHRSPRPVLPEDVI